MPKVKTPEIEIVSSVRPKRQEEEQCYAITVMASGISHQNMLALKKAAETIPLLDGTKLSIMYRNF